MYFTIWCHISPFAAVESWEIDLEKPNIDMADRARERVRAMEAPTVIWSSDLQMTRWPLLMIQLWPTQCSSVVLITRYLCSTQCVPEIIPSTWRLSPHTVFLDGHRRIIWSPLHCPTSISSDRERRKWVRLAEKLNGVIFNRFYSFPPREKPRSRKSAKASYFQLPLYPTLSSLLQQQLVQLVRNPAASHHSTQIAPFQSRLFVFGSNDHFWLKRSLPGSRTSSPNSTLFLLPVVNGGIKQMVLEPIFTSRKHEVHS